MNVEQVMASVVVADIEQAAVWYGTVFGRPADARPMDSLVEWRFGDAGTIQVSSEQAKNVGKSQVTIQVGDFDQLITDLDSGGIEHDDVATISSGARIVVIRDADGNTLFITGT